VAAVARRGLEVAHARARLAQLHHLHRLDGGLRVPGRRSIPALARRKSKSPARSTSTDMR
jgi:hypothetical protein